jgi:TonB family protein
MHWFLLISVCSFMCLCNTAYSQKRIYYDPLFRSVVETPTTSYRELIISDGRAAIKEVWNDTLIAEGVIRYGKHQTLINDFAHFMRSYGNPYQLKNEFEDMTGEIDYYKDGIKERKVVSYSAKMYNRQIWSKDGSEILLEGNGEYVYPQDGSMVHEHFKDSVLIEMFEVRDAQRDSIYHTYDKLAEPVDGYTSFMKEFARILKYPGLARIAGKQGLVYIEFIVDKKGKLSEFKPLTEEGFNLEKKAMEKLSRMPNWRPASFKGKPVKMKFTIPIRFRLT